MEHNHLNLKKILDLLEDFIMLVSSSGEIKYYTHLPLQAGEVQLEKPISINDIFSKSAANQILENVRLVLEEQKIKTFDIQFSSNGQLKSFNAKVTPYEDTDVLLWLNEVSEQRKNEDYLRKSEARFRILLDSAAQGIILSDMHGRINLINTQVEKTFGYNRDELTGQTIEKIIPSFYRDKHVRHRNDYILNPSTKKITFIPVKPSLNIDNIHDHDICTLSDVINTEQINEQRMGEDGKPPGFLGRYKNCDLFIKKGAYGMYAQWGSNRVNVDSEVRHLDLQSITYADIFKILEKDGVLNTKVPLGMVRQLSNTISIREGKYGDYIFYKKPRVKKPEFYKLNACTHDYKTCDSTIILKWIEGMYGIK